MSSNELLDFIYFVQSQNITQVPENLVHIICQHVQIMEVTIIHVNIRCKAHIEPGATQPVERVSAISLVIRHRTVAVTATETSHSPAMYIIIIITWLVLEWMSITHPSKLY